MPIEPWIQEAANQAAALDEQDRVRALQQIKGLAVAQAPEANVASDPVITLDEFLALDIPTPSMVASYVAYRGEVSSMSARAGKGKTTFSMNRFVRWACGRPMFPGVHQTYRGNDEVVMAPDDPVKTLVIENEGASGENQQHYKDIIEHGDFAEDERELIGSNILVWGDGSWSGVHVDDPVAVERLHQACETHKPDILFLEPFRSIWKGDENDVTAMEVALQVLKGIASAHDCAVMLTHHERKSGVGDGGDEMDASRGATALEGVCAIMERITPVIAGTQTELKWVKNRYRPKPAPLRYTFSFDTWGYELVPEEELYRQIKTLMQESPADWHHVPDLVAELDETQRRIRDACNHLTDAGELLRKKSDPREGANRGYRYRIKDSNSAQNGVDIG